MRILITTSDDFVSPRYDLTAEVILATCYDQQLLEKPHSILLSDISAEAISDIALKESVTLLICGGIEEQHYSFLHWKGIQVIESIIGPHAEALRLAMRNSLQPGAILPGATYKETIVC